MFVNKHRQRQEKNLQRRAKEVGYELKKIEVPNDEEVTPSSST